MVRDGFRDALADIAVICDDAARDQREARHAKGNAIADLMHASIDAETVLMRVADRVRRLRR